MLKSERFFDVRNYPEILFVSTAVDWKSKKRAEMRGELTLHGATRTVEIPIEGQLVDDGTIVVVGSLDITITDFDIVPPTGFSVLSIAETGIIELQLAFVPA